MIGRTNAGGGGTGATLTVNAPVGVSVIATNTATDRTYTRTANSNGVAVFKGLPTGTYSVHITDGTTTSKDFTATVVADYDLTVKFFSAYINVTYPAGSTCTCSDGNTSLVAPDTTGKCTFVVPNAGTWTVSCTTGTDTASQNVSITAEEQSEIVNLEYKLFLYRAGDTCDIVTGGWGKHLAGGLSVTFNSTDLKMTPTSEYQAHGAASTNKAITTTGYTMLKAIYSSSQKKADDRLRMGFISDYGSGGYWPTFASSVALNTGTNNTAKLAISGNVNKPVGFFCSDSNLTVYQVWLE